ncbi:unnamed protein product [Gongylonema pulchrum]|uniref:Uncharacterized protein n=1 Tax=Gongylonema pulchrum TaxID=637853 RepID=A0A183DQE9_9BILA|nr:unnamed protein product [Gongylonema pulchrum]
MSHNWTQQSATPGSVKPVYGAQYPPLTQQNELWNGAGRLEDAHEQQQQQQQQQQQLQQHSNPGTKFKNYVESVSDAWEVSVTLDERAASTSAAKVLERHAASVAQDLIMPPVNPIPSRNGKVQAMQRLAIQKGDVN